VSEARAHSTVGNGACPLRKWSRSDRGAVPIFRSVRFLGPPAEPDVRVIPASGSPQAHVAGLETDPGAHGVTSLIWPL